MVKTGRKHAWLAVVALVSPLTSPVMANSAGAAEEPIATGLCPIPQALIQRPLEPIANLQEGAIGVRSSRADIDSETQIASFFGDVEVQFGQQTLFTEQAQVNQLSGNINASGETLFTDGYVEVASENFRLNSGENRAYLSGATYQMRTNGARGEADILSLSEAQVRLEGATFTTCPTENPAWRMSAEQITINEDEAFGEARHAKIELFGVPVLYLPYLNFPVSDERKSGFLFPTVRSSQRHGFELELPYYLNLANNMDATITPRYMAKRGTMLQAEYRYLSEAGNGQVNFGYLNDDASLESEQSRFFWRLEQQQQWSPNWRSYINALVISDDDYINDFGSDFAGRADAQLYRHAQLDYHADALSAMLRIEDFELLGSYRAAYRTLPQLNLTYQGTGELGLDYRVYTELTRFQNQELSSDTVTRFHLEPELSYQVERPAYDWEANLSYSYTRYQQDANLLDGRSEDPDRALPSFRWRGRLNLERQFTWGERTYLQTLQPQIQYLYRPYRDQSGIGIYDSTLMQDDYRGLFRERRFSGLDRIADANQVTIGATTSFATAQAREVARFSIAQIHYFKESRTQLFDSSSAILNNNSDLAAEVRFQLSDNWSFASDLQYDMELNRTQKSQTALEYRKDPNNLFQISHRNAINLLDDDIEQIGMQAIAELTPQWQLAGNWYYDIENRRTNDALLALQYSDCCWALRFGFYRRINRNLELQQNTPLLGTPEFDNGFSVQLMIKGLGSDNRSLIDLLEQSLFGYRHPFHLSN
ncbi:LPS-assembly protein LptD [Pseudidiomarina taiwanensis]|uniref:LPS-assembly protein LptD n=1 Tax=Pseudidiomarina taiwanensis TaxID=337250 RepID=A0A432ZCD5_9GAMM|nr:LPS assembly protein LptD [Pseudidiomarina taiwanensis]RUO75596.1 LPS-assembly protein LptD [Pseudidiomarina taiwanensis]